MVNPGGRLHDDFSEYNALGDNVVTNKTKDIYVENFAGETVKHKDGTLTIDVNQDYETKFTVLRRLTIYSC